MFTVDAVVVVGPIAKKKKQHLFLAGMLNTSFKKRWFVLKGNLLFYFKSPTDKEPIGLIILGMLRE